MLVGSIVTTVCAAPKEEKKGGYVIGYSHDYRDEKKWDEGDMITESIHSKHTQYDDSQQYISDSPVMQDAPPEAERIIRSLKKQLELKDRKIDVLEKRLTRAQKRLKTKETEFFMLQPKTADQYVVRAGDSLWKIASRNDTYGNPYMWITIYNANMSKIKDPNLIFSGQLFDIPK